MGDPDALALRERYLDAIEREIAEGRARLNRALAGRENTSSRAKVLAAIADVNLVWLEAERERVRAGEPFDEAAARRLLGE
jgi:hypothetical protein